MLKIAAVNLLDDLGLRDVQQFVVALEILASPIPKALSAKLSLSQLVLLDDGAHRAIEDHDALAQEAFKLFCPATHVCGPHKTQCFQSSATSDQIITRKG